MSARKEPEQPETCGECKLFNPTSDHERSKLKNGSRARGQCRFFAPSSNSYPVFPEVFSDEVACRQGQKAPVG